MNEREHLDDRKASILRAIVEEYVETAQPVGSATIARSRDLGVSSATVRNDMTVLEREGYLVQPHIVVAVAVMSNGTVEKEVVALDRDHEVEEDQLARLGAWLTESLQGEPLAAMVPPSTTGDAHLDVLAAGVCEALAARAADAS